MPAILEKCVREVMDKGHDQQSAWAICRSSLGLAADGSQDKADVQMDDKEMLIRVQSEITKREFGSFPTFKKRMQLCQAVGKYVNGDQKGDLSLELFKQIVANFKKHPRQIPVYLLVGQPDPEHPTDLDARLADGWVESLAVEGDWLVGDVKLLGNAAVAVLRDEVRGASIGAIRNDKGYDGKPIGPVLEHVVLTNAPFVKGMNIAASRTGGEKVVEFFTALSAESKMPEKKPPETPPEGQPPEEVVQLKAQLSSTEEMLDEAKAKIRDLEASNANLTEENETLRQSPAHGLALKRIDQLERINKAERIRRKIKKGVDEGRFDPAFLVNNSWDSDSDEKVLAWFKTASPFKDSEDKLDFALSTFKKTSMRRNFFSGNPQEKDSQELTAEEKEQSEAIGVDPKVAFLGQRAGSYSQFKSAMKKED